MKSVAKLRYLRIAPRKVRLVAETIRGKKVGEAQAILRFTTNKATEPIEKTLRSALASAKHNFELEDSNLYVSKITVDEGPKLKRYRPRARGRAYPIQKKTSHITLVLDEIVPTTPEDKKKRKTKKQEPAAVQEQVKEGVKTPKPKFRPQREVTNRGSEGGARKFFRRKAV